MGDNFSLVKLSSSEDVPLWELSSCLHDIRVLTKLWNINFRFVERSCNKAIPLVG